jgi:hypothetical protein
MICRFRVFEAMQAARLIPNSFTLSTLFSALVYGFGGNQRAGARKVIELSRTWVNPRTLNHHVASSVLRALAEAGTASDVDKFWAFCGSHLGRTRKRWPGPSFDILRDLSQKYSSRGHWPRIAELLKSNASQQTPSRP